MALSFPVPVVLSKSSAALRGGRPLVEGIGWVWTRDGGEVNAELLEARWNQGKLI